MEQLLQDLAVLDQAMGIQIGLINEFSRSGNPTPIQRIIAHDHRVSIIQLQHDLFCEALQDKIDALEKEQESKSVPTSPRASIIPVLQKSASFLMKSPRRYNPEKRCDICSNIYCTGDRFDCRKCGTTRSFCQNCYRQSPNGGYKSTMG